MYPTDDRYCCSEAMPRANIVLSIVGTIAPSVRERRDDRMRAGACGM